MTSVAPLDVLVDSSVVLKWELAGEAHAAEADELLEDWRHGVIRVSTSDQLPVELASALLGACRKPPVRLLEAAALQTLGDLLALPLVYRPTQHQVLLRRAFAIALNHNQRVYDCVYVALAEAQGLEFWAGDRRLYNALSSSFPFIRWIGGYVRRRP